MVYLGIDPGNEGALAVLPAIQGREIEFHDTPLIPVVVQKAKGKKVTRKLLNVPAMRLMLSAIQQQFGDEIFAVIEKVAPMPSTHEGDKGAKMGATSAFNFGKGCGLWIGLLAGLQIPYEEVHPATWKAALMRDTNRDKGASIIKATQLYPSAAKHLTRLKDHGRADALLMAEYARRSQNVVHPPHKKQYPPDCAEDLMPGLFQ